MQQLLDSEDEDKEDTNAQAYAHTLELSRACHFSFLVSCARFKMREKTSMKTIMKMITMMNMSQTTRMRTDASELQARMLQIGLRTALTARQVSRVEVHSTHGIQSTPA